MDRDLELLECPVCLDVFNMEDRLPKALPCFHNICLPCINKLVKDNCVMCPLCKENHKVPTDLTILKNNPLMMGFLEKHSESKKSETNAHMKRDLDEMARPLQELMIAFSKRLVAVAENSQLHDEAVLHCKENINDTFASLMDALSARKTELLNEVDKATSKIHVEEVEGQLANITSLRTKRQVLASSRNVNEQEFRVVKENVFKLQGLAEIDEDEFNLIAVNFDHNVVNVQSIKLFGQITHQSAGTIRDSAWSQGVHKQDSNSGIDTYTPTHAAEALPGVPHQFKQTRRMNRKIRTETTPPEPPCGCAICMCPFRDKMVLPKCKHAFCRQCIDDCFAKMKPVCPICGAVYGKVEGNQPEGKMNIRLNTNVHMPGYEMDGTIMITYLFPSGTQGPRHPLPGQAYYGAQRMAYLPDNTEGRKVLALLKKAFDAKLVFTIGLSVTTGHDDQVTWNGIHHKTSVTGGPQANGYPDPGYLKRVQEELAAKGIIM